MLVKDETKYCWVDNGKAGEPQDSIKDAIADYLECIDDVGDSDHSYAWEKKYGFENNAWVVFETKEYSISDYIDEYGY